MKTSPAFTISAGAAILLGVLAAPVRADILYVANQDNSTIDKFTPGGALSVFASSGLSGPRFLAFTTDAGVPLRLPAMTAAIPEPSTWALVALGIAALPVLRRFGRRSARPASTTA